MSLEFTGNKQIAKNLIYNTISFVINFVIAFFFTPYLIRVVGKEAYGFFPLVNNMIGYTSIITTAVGSMAGRFITMRIYKDDIKYFANPIKTVNGRAIVDASSFATWYGFTLNENNGTLKGLDCHEISIYFLMKSRGTKELNSNKWCHSNHCNYTEAV